MARTLLPPTDGIRKTLLSPVDSTPKRERPRFRPILIFRALPDYQNFFETDSYCLLECLKLSDRFAVSAVAQTLVSAVVDAFV